MLRKVGIVWHKNIIGAQNPSCQPRKTVRIASLCRVHLAFPVSDLSGGTGTWMALIPETVLSLSAS